MLKCAFMTTFMLASSLQGVLGATFVGTEWTRARNNIFRLVPAIAFISWDQINVNRNVGAGSSLWSVPCSCAPACAWAKTTLFICRFIYFRPIYITGSNLTFQTAHRCKSHQTKSTYMLRADSSKQRTAAMKVTLSWASFTKTESWR